MTASVKQMTTLDDLEVVMREWVEQTFFNSPFFEALAAGQYTPIQLRHFAIQYGYYSRHFPRVLGAAISAMAPYPQWWMPLADNLWDEAGRGVPGKSHEELYRTFLLSVDPTVTLDAQGLPPEPMSSVVAQATDFFIDFFRRSTPLEAMAAVGLGSEFFAGEVMGRIGHSLEHMRYQQHHEFDLTFWRVHAETDEPRHYQLCRSILQQFRDPADLGMMLETGQMIAASELAMYTGLHQEMQALVAR
ncbi:hypothetical protein BXT84_09300 [Sulfobacillus thermotolerans]|uniref:Uncharacterized protein n=1 Tax=Sulfobacillus thermotolerans TaxID=338644 RepID=A0ABM6RS10_9FIRM|nr:hypothetical protein BXT84_09300 [Sulfobacillus thermotolerans]